MWLHTNYISCLCPPNVSFRPSPGLLHLPSNYVCFRPMQYVLMGDTALELFTLPSLLLCRSTRWLNFNFLHAYFVFCKWMKVDREDFIFRGVSEHEICKGTLRIVSMRESVNDGHCSSLRGYSLHPSLCLTGPSSFYPLLLAYYSRSFWNANVGDICFIFHCGPLKQMSSDQPAMMRISLQLAFKFLAFLFIASCGIQLLELVGDPSAVETEDGSMAWSNALYFAVITLMTVGYGDFVPYTLCGRIWVVFNAMYVIYRRISILLSKPSFRCSNLFRDRLLPEIAFPRFPTHIHRLSLSIHSVCL